MKLPDVHILLKKKEYSKLKNLPYPLLALILMSNDISEIDKAIIYMLNDKQADKIYWCEDICLILQKNYKTTYTLMEDEYFLEKIRYIFDNYLIEVYLPFFKNLPSKFIDFIGYYNKIDELDNILENSNVRNYLFNTNVLSKFNNYGAKWELVRSICSENEKHKKVNFFLNMNNSNINSIAYYRPFPDINKSKEDITKLLDTYFEGMYDDKNKDTLILMWFYSDEFTREKLIEVIRDCKIDYLADGVRKIISIFDNDVKYINRIINFILYYDELYASISNKSLTSTEIDVLKKIIRFGALQQKPKDLKSAISLFKSTPILESSKKTFRNASPEGNKSGIYFDFKREVIDIAPTGHIKEYDATYSSHDEIIRNYFPHNIYVSPELSYVNLAEFIASLGRVILVIEEEVAYVYLPYELTTQQTLAIEEKMHKLNMKEKSALFGILQVLEHNEFFDKTGNINSPKAVKRYIYNDGNLVTFDEFIEYLSITKKDTHTR